MIALSLPERSRHRRTPTCGIEGEGLPACGELDPAQLDGQVRGGGSGDDGPTKAELYERAAALDER
jgi:hypothetical protein